MEKRAEILAIMQVIQDTNYDELQSPAQLLEYAFKLTGWISFSGETVAEAKELLHNARRKAYINLVASLGAQEKKIGTMLIKEFVLDSCAKESAYLTLCERCNSAATHAADVCRSALSYLKTEMNNLSYSNR
jgi:hypothetical protein